MVCEGLEPLGIYAARIEIVPTNEELVIARHTRDVVGHAHPGDVD